MKLMKRNQVIIFVVALMLVAAGYFNYTLQNKEVAVASNEISEIGDAQLVSSSDMIAGREEINNVIEEANKDVQETNSDLAEIQMNQTQTSTAENDYFTSSRMSRDVMYSQMIETYQKVLENPSVSEAQKSISSQEIVKINETKNAIMITENLIKSKGIEEVVILVNTPSVNVIVKGKNLAQEQIAQIQNIVSREMKTEIENIHISNQ